MDFQRKIYINNKPLVLTNDAESYQSQHNIAHGYLLLRGAFHRHFRLALKHLQKMRAVGAIIEDISPKALIDGLHEFYKPMDAAGGVVVNENGDTLMIYRRGKWDLPKGKCEAEESISECAIREVMEETGLERIELGKKLGETFHIYEQGQSKIIKRTVWFAMKADSRQQLLPQKEENIMEVRWVSPDNIDVVAFKSYEAIREVLRLNEQ